MFGSPLGRLGGTWLHLSPVKLCVQSWKIWRDKIKMPFAGSGVLQIPWGTSAAASGSLRFQLGRFLHVKNEGYGAQQ